MVYYHTQISENTSNLCLINIHLGKYHCKRLPIGVSKSLDIFQQKMNDLFHGFEFIHAYIDGILELKKGDWIDHVQKSESTLNKLK